ncbi:MAG: hypothetical protein IBJ12_10685 [Sphingomonadaceae bacterium]|nr:hypothetical protein [Sphingomonadaceae bacterium]
MTYDSPHPHEPDITGTILDFTPVAFDRRRAKGWTPLTQRRFIEALSVMGSVGAAARAVGMGRVSAYRLLEREGAESFAAAWEKAINLGRSHQYSVAMAAAINGVTTIYVQRGGSVTVRGGPDMGLVRAALRDEPAPNRVA